MCLLIYLLPGRKEIMSFVIRLCLKLLPNCRWYNVDIYFKNESLKDKRFAGIIFRDEELNFAIEVIERVSNVHFTREGETIYIEDKHE